MPNRPLVSIILPVYNVEPYLEECLRSILNQTYPLTSIELLAINDGSTDRSLNIIKKYEKLFPNIQIIDQENRGLGAVRNRGLELARGDYIYFLDSDDWIDSELVSDCVNVLEEQDLQVCHFQKYNVYDLNADGKVSRPRLVQSKNQTFEIERGLDFLKKQMCVRENCAPVWQYFFYTRFLKEHHFSFPEGILHEDEPFTIRVLLLAKRFLNLEKAYFFRRLRPGSIMTSTKRSIIAQNYQSVLIEMDSFFFELDFEQAKLLSRYMSILLISILSLYTRNEVWHRRQDLWKCAKMTRRSSFEHIPDFFGGVYIYFYGYYCQARRLISRLLKRIVLKEDLI